MKRLHGSWKVLLGNDRMVDAFHSDCWELLIQTEKTRRGQPVVFDEKWPPYVRETLFMIDALSHRSAQLFQGVGSQPRCLPIQVAQLGASPDEWEVSRVCGFGSTW